MARAVLLAAMVGCAAVAAAMPGHHNSKHSKHAKHEEADDISESGKEEAGGMQRFDLRRNHNPDPNGPQALHQSRKEWGAVFYQPSKTQRTYDADVAQGVAELSSSGHEILITQRQHTAPMHGGVSDVGQFYVDVSLGDPPQKLTAQIDTGSTTIAFPAVGCQQVDAGVKCDDVHLYDYTASNASAPISCHEPEMCSEGGCSSWQKDACAFSLSYADQSGADGFLVHDKLRIYGRHGNPLVGDITFGAIKQEKGKFQEFPIINGIIGMAFAGLGCNPSCTDSLIGQVHTNNAVQNRFGMCLGQGGGALVVGGVDEASFMGEIQYVKMVSQHYYEIALETVSIDGIEQPLAPDTGAMIDSGTTLLLLNQVLWDGFLEQVRSKCISGTVYPHCPRSESDQDAPDPACQAKVDAMYLSTSKGQCYPLDHELKVQCFPTFEFAAKSTAGSVMSMALHPDQYIYVLIDKGKPYHCPAVNLNRMAQITLGDAFMQAHYIDFDRHNKQLGFAKANIDKCGGNTMCHTLKSCGQCSQDPACFWGADPADPTNLKGRCANASDIPTSNVCSNHIQRPGSACNCNGVVGPHISEKTSKGQNPRVPHTHKDLYDPAQDTALENPSHMSDAALAAQVDRHWRMGTENTGSLASHWKKNGKNEMDMSAWEYRENVKAAKEEQSEKDFMLLSSEKAAVEHAVEKTGQGLTAQGVFMNAGLMAAGVAGAALVAVAAIAARRRNGPVPSSGPATPLLAASS